MATLARLSTDAVFSLEKERMMTEENKCPVCEKTNSTRRLEFGWDSIGPYTIYSCDGCDCRYRVDYKVEIISKHILEIKDYEREKK